MSDYKAVIIDHYKNPRNFGEMDKADLTMDEANASCGDMIRIQVKFRSQMSDVRSQTIEKMRWRGVGCAISTAAASMLSEKVVGMSKEDLEKFGEAGIIEMLGGEINPGRMKCATLAYRGLIRIFEKDE